jgi:putative transcriptional regulator
VNFTFRNIGGFICNYKVYENKISSIETGKFNPTAKLALLLCIALDKKFEDLFYF